MSKRSCGCSDQRSHASPAHAACGSSCSQTLTALQEAIAGTRRSAAAQSSPALSQALLTAAELAEHLLESVDHDRLSGVQAGPTCTALAVVLFDLPADLPDLCPDLNPVCIQSEAVHIVSTMSELVGDTYQIAALENDLLRRPVTCAVDRCEPPCGVERIEAQIVQLQALPSFDDNPDAARAVRTLILELRTLADLLQASSDPSFAICDQVLAVLSQVDLLLATFPLAQPFEIGFVFFHGVEHLSTAILPIYAQLLLSSVPGHIRTSRDRAFLRGR